MSTQWDSDNKKIVNHPNGERLNACLMQEYYRYLNAMYALRDQGKLHVNTAGEFRDVILDYVFPERVVERKASFAEWYGRFVNRKTGRTKQLYEATWKQIEKFQQKAHRLRFEDINKAWLEEFFISMEKTSPSINARNIHLRNIRAVFNDAIDNEVTTVYPFRRYKIHPAPTAKRNLPIDELRKVFAMNDLIPRKQRFVDMFKLMFLLIGINPVDLFNLTHDNVNGDRIRYVRAKTHKLYDIRIEPEAQAILDKYKGEKMLLSLSEHYKSYRICCEKMGATLHEIRSDLSCYWARHSWATIAASIDIPDDTIALALGHSAANPTTSIYIERDKKKVDEANRRVIDYVLQL
jgi:integrase